MKHCYKCATDKTASEFHKSRRSKDGLCSECKDCARARARRWRVENAVRHPEPTVRDKACAECAAVKPAAEFYRAPERRDGLSRLCRRCHNAEVTRRNQVNRAAYRARWQRWADDNREHLRETQRKWRKDNRLKALANSANTRARRAGVPGLVTEEDIAFVLTAYGDTCLRCGADDLTVDHVVPMSVGGENALENLQPLCLACNSGKKDNVADYRPKQDAA